MASLTVALDELAAVLDRAQDPWWLIGSAAARLHGADTCAADVDVLLSRRDALAVMAAWRGELAIGGSSERFHSWPFARLTGASMPIELMAGLHVRSADRWRAIRPLTRQSIGKVYVPERSELCAIFDLFGRPKDRERADQLRGLAKRSFVTQQ